MIRIRLVIIALFLISVEFSFGQQSFDTRKPWTYWWWMGSAVDSANIERQLKNFSDVGIGGMHIIPIYGAKGWEDRFLDFLSDDWMQMVSYTLSKADSLGLGVDLTLGTGWPYGGPMVTPEMAAKKLDLTQVQPGDTIISVIPTRQKVKRAAPGGEGWVLDFFDLIHVESYLDHFDSVFNNSAYLVKPRAFYNDSYEVYGADWSDEFAGQFMQDHGYDARPLLFLLKEPDHQKRPALIHDLRETLSGLLYSSFTEPWANFCKEQGVMSRNQAHGSPGNILDLYGLADIPETESFGCSEFGIPGLNCDPDYEPEKFGRPSPLMMKFASSPAHLLGKPLVSSESTTWLANHFKVSLKQIKPQIDELFVAGINHVFYHGTTYSPAEEPWPGWLFYASTNYGNSAHFYDELPLLNQYIETCQTALQSAEPDNDILLYFPIHDLWTTYPGNMLVLLDVHKYNRWFNATPFGKTAQELWDNGYCFDYISDLQICTADISQYDAIVIPPSEVIPEETRQALESLSRGGFPVIYSDSTVQLSNQLKISGIPNESLKLQGLDFIRKKNPDGQLYFITNLSDQYRDDTVSLSVTDQFLKIIKPVSGETGTIKSKGSFRLQLEPGESCLIQTSKTPMDEAPWVFDTYHDTLILSGDWEVGFKHRYEDITYPVYHQQQLRSFTEWGNKDLESFCGKATYTQIFSVPPGDIGKACTLRIDQVNESARVIINGQDCGTIWTLPARLPIPSGLIREENQIELIVQNLSANYLRKVDQERPEWKKFYDINFADITYKPFKASNWELVPSGICGSVYLTFEKSWSAITRGDTLKKEIALVFTGDEFGDGGRQIRRTLKKQSVPGSFFLTGNFYRNPGNKKIIHQLVEDGHYLGAHSDRHLLYCSWENRDRLLVSEKEFKDDLLNNYAQMDRFGVSKPEAPLFLPPYEWYNDSIVKWTADLGLQLINYTPGTLSHADYTIPDEPNYRDSQTILSSILKYEAAHPNGLNGFILLSHIGTAPARTDKFYHHLDQLITTLKSKGYHFKKITHLIPTH